MSASPTTELPPAAEVALVPPRLSVCMAISSAYHRAESTQAQRIELIALAVCVSWPAPQPWARGAAAAVKQAETTMRFAQEGAARAAPDEMVAAAADVRSAQRALSRALSEQDIATFHGESPQAEAPRAPDALRIAGVSPAQWLPVGRDLIDSWTAAYGVDSRYTLLPPASSGPGGGVVAAPGLRRSGA